MSGWAVWSGLDSLLDMPLPVRLKSTPKTDDPRESMVVGRNSFPGIAPETANARRFGRLKCEMLASTLGDVIDVSGSGLRIRTPGKPPVKIGQEFDLQVHGLGQAVILPVKCVWIKRTGLFKREVGLQIGEINEETRSLLTRIAHLGAVKTVVQP